MNLAEKAPKGDTSGNEDTNEQASFLPSLADKTSERDANQSSKESTQISRRDFLRQTGAALIAGGIAEKTSQAQQLPRSPAEKNSQEKDTTEKEKRLDEELASIEKKYVAIFTPTVKDKELAKSYANTHYQQSFAQKNPRDPKAIQDVLYNQMLAAVISRNASQTLAIAPEAAIKKMERAAGLGALTGPRELLEKVPDFDDTFWRSSAGTSYSKNLKALAYVASDRKAWNDLQARNKIMGMSANPWLNNVSPSIEAIKNANLELAGQPEKVAKAIEEIKRAARQSPKYGQAAKEADRLELRRMLSDLDSIEKQVGSGSKEKAEAGVNDLKRLLENLSGQKP